MPHLSKHKISKDIKEQIDKKVVGFLTDTNQKVRKGIFNEVFTQTERLMIAKRIAMIYMISKNTPTHTISRALKVSPSTVARFEINTANSRYRLTSAWVKDYEPINTVLRMLFDIASVPFDVRRKSLKQLVEDREY